MTSVLTSASKPGRLRSAIAYPLPYFVLLAPLPLVRDIPVDRWFALPAPARAILAFALIISVVTTFLVISDALYKLIDPAGLGRKTHSRTDLCELLVSVGLIALGVAWLLHVRELHWAVVFLLPTLAVAWLILLGTLRRALIESQRQAAAGGPAPVVPAAVAIETAKPAAAAA